MGYAYVVAKKSHLRVLCFNTSKYWGASFNLYHICDAFVRWIETCVEEDLPPTTELEQALRNGVILCKLGHYCAPDVIPYKKIYDLDESRYRVRKRVGRE